MTNSKKLACFQLVFQLISMIIGVIILIGIFDFIRDYDFGEVGSDWTTRDVFNHTGIIRWLLIGLLSIICFVLGIFQIIYGATSKDSNTIGLISGIMTIIGLSLVAIVMNIVVITKAE